MATRRPWPIFADRFRRKLADYSKKVPLKVNPAVAPLFIVQPLLPGGLSGLFSTHPPIEQRIARLEQMAGSYLPDRS